MNLFNLPEFLFFRSAEYNVAISIFIYKIGWLIMSMVESYLYRMQYIKMILS